MKYVLSLVVLTAVLLSAGFASGAMLTPLVELHNLVESGADRFGRSVDMDGAFTIIGADLDADNGAGAGAVFVYNTTTGAQLFKLKSTDGNAGDYFGASVAVSGNYAVIGASGREGIGTSTTHGAAYVFDLTTGNQIAKLVANVPQSSNYGMTVAMSGDNVVVTSHRYTVSGVATSGAVFHYDLGSLVAHGTEAGTFTENTMFTAPSLVSGGQFGTDVDIDGTTLIVGEGGMGTYNTPSWQRAGDAHLFDVSTGGLLATIVPTETAAKDAFGNGVAIDGNVAAVGANRASNGSSVITGVAYLFDVTTLASPTQLFRLEEVGGSLNDQFGMNVDLDNGTLLVAIQSDDEGFAGSGSAMLFSATTGAMLQKLLASDASGNAIFGNDVALSGDFVVVGATGPDHAYIFGPVPGQPDPGDFDGDNDIDDIDIDLLAEAIRTGSADFGTFDISTDGTNDTPDGVIDENDLNYLVHFLAETSAVDGLGDPIDGTEFGDFNLDGLVNTTDLAVLATNYGPNSAWSLGNANGHIDEWINTTDLAILGAFFNFDASLDVIPEPMTLSVMGCGAIGLLRRRRRA